MSDLMPPSTDGGQAMLVSATELARNFGRWRDEAARAPVYVQHRGQPRLVLASIDLLQRLMRPATEQARVAADTETLIDALPDPILLLNADGSPQAVNRAAATFLGLPAALVVESFSGTLADAIRDLGARVAASGIAERVEWSEGERRRVEAIATPLGQGAALILRDLAVREALDAARASTRAVGDAVEAMDGAALVRLSLRATLEDGVAALARLTRAKPDALRAARFVSLFDVQSRIAVGEAIERVLRLGETQRLDAKLLVGGAQPRPVRLVLSANRHRIAIEGATALLIECPSD